jgi:replicative DNA helicase
LLTITRAKTHAGKAGEPLPTVFQRLEANTIHIRRGQLTLIAAAPGVGKSLMSLKVALGAKVPAYYFSADTDAFTMYLRCAASELGWRMEDIENQVKSGNTKHIDTTLNAATSHIRWSFDSSPAYEDIEQELEAFALTYGEWPALIVVDNLRNVFAPDGNTDTDGVCQWLKEIASMTGAAVIGLHHVTGSYNNGDVPIPLGGLLGQVGKIPETILTLHRVGSDIAGWTMRVCPVKNRTGKADASGGWVLDLPYEPERMRLG